MVLRFDKRYAEAVDESRKALAIPSNSLPAIRTIQIFNDFS